MLEISEKNRSHSVDAYSKKKGMKYSKKINVSFLSLIL